jgi:hypothetical protein
MIIFLAPILNSAIQTKIRLHFGGFFSSYESAQANRKRGFYADRDPNMLEVGVIFALKFKIRAQKILILVYL